jgi:ribosomal protein S18 acetylase RimI-like enzyme
MDESDLAFQVCKTPEEITASQSAEAAVLDGLGRNIVERIGNVELGRPIRIFIRDRSDKVVGGVVAHCFGGWAFIALLWIEKSLRNRGYGTRLVRMLEAEAVQCGCRYAHLDTYSFEAKPFYARLGFEVFAVLEDYPIGHRKYFLKKRLAGKGLGKDAG